MCKATPDLLARDKKRKKERKREREKAKHIIEFLWTDRQHLKTNIQNHWFVHNHYSSVLLSFLLCGHFTFNRITLVLGRSRLWPPSLSQRVMSSSTIMHSMVWMMSLGLCSHCGFFSPLSGPFGGWRLSILHDAVAGPHRVWWAEQRKREG